MSPDFDDTIVALATPPGPAGRAIVRVSGPQSLAIVQQIFTPAAPVPLDQRALTPGNIRLVGVHSPLPAELYSWPAPKTYTGQEMAELHTLSSPPLIDLLIAQLLNAGARAARAGEFTQRAFLAGKLDLTRAEAVLALIQVSNRDELKAALGQLAGGVSRPLHGLREDLLDLLADVEAGLDFAEEDVQVVGQREILDRLARVLAAVTLAGKKLDGRSVTTIPFRIVLVGRPNAGKSSLFNALCGLPAALVSTEPGTTRDYLVGVLDLGSAAAELVDTAGWGAASDAVGAQAQQLGRGEASNADLLLVCREPGDEAPFELPDGAGLRLEIGTKSDLGRHPDGMLATSATTGDGLEALRESLAKHACTRARPALAPSTSRCRAHVQACLDHLRRAHGAALFEETPELLALELRGALDELGALVGAVYTDDLLDRIFSRFCVGK